MSSYKDSPDYILWDMKSLGAPDEEHLELLGTIEAVISHTGRTYRESMYSSARWENYQVRFLDGSKGHIHILGYGNPDGACGWVTTDKQRAGKIWYWMRHPGKGEVPSNEGRIW